MKYIIYVFVIVNFLGCKGEPHLDTQTKEGISDTLQGKEHVSPIVSENSIKLNQIMRIERETKDFSKKKEKQEQSSPLLIDKRYFKDNGVISFDFHYPLLNEKINHLNVNFNDYVIKYYVNIKGTEAGIRAQNELLFDTLYHNGYQEKRFIDYKVYYLNDERISLLLYKENFYSGMLHSSYAFKCLNFDLDRGVFLKYEDLFITGSEEEVRSILNEKIEKNIYEGHMYYDCWPISENEFYAYKENFVLTNTFIEYFFDDCVICPSYTGSYSVMIPLEDLLPVLKRYELDPREIQ